MLKKRQSITIDGESYIDDVKVATFRAVIDGANPKNVRFTVIRNNEDAYKEHRVAVRADEAEFEDFAYEIQNNLLTKNN